MDEPRIHPKDSERKWFRVVYAVTLDVLAFDEHEAAIVGEAAAGWPGNWSPPPEPIPVQGEINGWIVQGQLVRSQALMVKEKK